MKDTRMIIQTCTLDINTLLPQIEDRLFDAVDTVCLERATLLAHAYEMHVHEPVPIKRAMALDHVLSHMTLNLSDNPVFAGNTSSRLRAWMLTPECSWSQPNQVFIEHDELSQAWVDAQIPEKLRQKWIDLGQSGHGSGGVGHVSIDYGMVVREGLAGVIKRLDQSVEDSPSAITYRQAMKLTCDAMIKWAHRLADHAQSLAITETDPVVRACHQRVVESCQHVPEHHARNLHEALQAMLLVHLGLALEGQGQSISIGLPDRALSDFCNEVNADFQGSVQLIRAFLIGVASNSFTGRGSKTQAITLGGALPDGSDACNSITMAFLHAFEKTAVADPHCFFRWHPDVEKTTWDKVISLLSKGRSMPLLVNDQQVVPGLIHAGVAAKDAWDYCIIGCNELGIPGRLSECSAAYGLGINDLAILNEVIRNTPDDFSDTMSIVTAWQDRLEERLTKGWGKRNEALKHHRRTIPMTLTSCLCHGCAEAGRDWVDGQNYHLPGCFTRGSANAINALAAIDQLVFKEHRYALSQMLTMLDADAPQIYTDIDTAPKWGNDDDVADQWALALGVARKQAMENARLAQGVDTPPLILCHVVRSLHHVDGKHIPATPDGRHAFEPVGDSIAAICGTTTQGPTAILNSVLKIDALGEFAGIYNNNLSLPGNQASPPVLKAMVEAFFEDGGQELQVNVLDYRKLLAARENPSAYKDLVVRIAGLNARFIELSQAEQDEIIRRAKLASVC